MQQAVTSTGRVVKVEIINGNSNKELNLNSAPVLNPARTNGRWILYSPLLGNIWVGTELYLKSDYKYIGKVVDIESGHLFPDGSKRDGVKIDFAEGGLFWMPRETVINIYLAGTGKRNGKDDNINSAIKTESNPILPMMIDEIDTGKPLSSKIPLGTRLFLKDEDKYRYIGRVIATEDGHLFPDGSISDGVKIEIARKYIVLDAQKNSNGYLCDE